MPDRPQNVPEGVNELEEAENALQQALLRLTSPQAQALQVELDRLREQIDALKKLEGENKTELQRKLEETSSIIDGIVYQFQQLGEELRDPACVEQRLDTTMVPALRKQVIERGDDVAEALAPVVGPAIRRQIRDAKEDIIDALYPLIGQIITKAISESLRELTRNIDTRLRQQLNFRDRIGHMMARLRGVSEAELLIRDSLPYSIDHVFLVHRETGLLLSHVSLQQANAPESMDTISGMLTAIQDFVRDSFAGGEGNLEEITHGGRRILLESGLRAYVAVVLRGVEPVGYAGQIRDVCSAINVEHENELKNFDGHMERLPDFKAVLTPLLSPQPSPLARLETGKPLSRPQKRFVGITLTSLILLIGLLIFACVFMIKLWPVAFPGAPLPMPTSTKLPSLTPTPLPTSTPTRMPSLTPTLVPTRTPLPTSSPPPIGVLTGNLNLRAEPSTGSAVIRVLLAGEKVIVRDTQNGWYQVAWPVEGDPKLEGWLWGFRYLQITP